MQTREEMQRGGSANPAATTLGSSTVSYLGPGLQIKGQIIGNEDLNLDSMVEGEVSIGGFRLTIGSRAHVAANIVAREAVIAGNVIGDVSAYDRIEIKNGASIVGDLITGKIMIEEGAYFKGGVEIDSSNPQIGKDLDTILQGSKNSEKK